VFSLEARSGLPALRRQPLLPVALTHQSCYASDARCLSQLVTRQHAVAGRHGERPWHRDTGRAGSRVAETVHRESRRERSWTSLSR